MERSQHGRRDNVRMAKYRSRDRRLTKAVIRLTGELIGTAELIERNCRAVQRCAGKALRDAREAQGLSLREAAKAIRLSPAALSQLERAKTWETATAARAIRVLAAMA